jgi:predicted aconitase with swiveling domain
MGSGPELARGHCLAAGVADGPAFVTESVSFWGGIAAANGEIIDVHHPALGQSVTGTVLVMPYGRGSSSASAVFAETLRLGVGPAAIVLRSNDVILAVGAAVARELYGATCPIVELDDAGFAAVAAHDGERLRVEAGPSGATVSVAAS